MSKETRMNSPQETTDDINLLEYVYALVKHKWLIIIVTLLGVVGGYFAAKRKGPTWTAEVVIAPKETENQKTPNFSSFGALGGIVASQLSMGGNASLEKIDMLLDSRDFNARMIMKYDLLPELYRYKWPKVYNAEWDSGTGSWKKSFRQPELLGMGDFLRGTFLKKGVRDNLMTLGVSSGDSALSYNLAERYVEFLNEDLKRSVRESADENVQYLERQLLSIADPLLREKIQALIADEIEKTMLVSKEAFQVIDPVYMQKRFKEKKLYPIVFGAGMFLMIMVLVVFIHAVLSGERTPEDKVFIEKIIKELLPGSGKK